MTDNDNPVSNPAGLHPVIDQTKKPRGRPKKEGGAALTQQQLRMARAGALLAEVAEMIGWRSIAEIAEAME